MSVCRKGRRHAFISYHALQWRHTGRWRFGQFGASSSDNGHRLTLAKFEERSSLPSVERAGQTHQFRTRNDLATMQRTRTKSNESAAKSTNAFDILPLITVWFLVRVQAGPPTKSGAYQELFRRSGITAPETCCPEWTASPSSTPCSGIKTESSTLRARAASRSARSFASPRFQPTRRLKWLSPDFRHKSSFCNGRRTFTMPGDDERSFAFAHSHPAAA